MYLSLRILRRYDFCLLLLTRLLGTMAMSSQAVIVGWQVFSLTKSEFMLGAVGLAEAIPAIACAFFAGHVVDTKRPHRVFLIFVGLLVLNMLSLFLVGGGIVQVSNVVLWLFIGVFTSGLARSFLMPSSFALLPRIVPKEELSSASAWLVSFFQIGAISGPAIAGLVYGGYGPRVAWMIPVSLMAVEFVLLILMSAPVQQARSEFKHEPALRSILTGWSFILANRTLLAVMALDMFAVLFGGAVAMLPAFADKVLHDPTVVGFLRAAPAVGSGVTAVALAIWPMKQIRATTLLWVVAAFGGSMIGFGLSTGFWLAFGFLILSGVFDSISMVIRSTLMQLLVPDHMRGRVSAVNSMFVISSNEIGAFESGTAAALLGLVPSIVFGGICTLVVVAFTAVVAPVFRRTVVSGE